jgi:hypothetical protein
VKCGKINTMGWMRSDDLNARRGVVRCWDMPEASESVV